MLKSDFMNEMVMKVKKMKSSYYESIFGKNIKASGEIFSLSLVNSFHTVVVRFSEASSIPRQ